MKTNNAYFQYLYHTLYQVIFLFLRIPFLPIITFLFLPFLISHLFRKQIIKQFALLFRLLSLFLLCLELSRILTLLATNQFHIQSDMSLQLCFLYPMICSLAIMTKKHYFYDYIACSSLLFGIGAIILFSYQGSFFQFPIINNYIYHSTIILIGLMFYQNHYKIKFQAILPISIIFFTQLFIAYLVNYILGPKANYMFLSTILEPENSIYYTPTLAHFYTPTIFPNSIAHYLSELKSFLGNTNYTLSIIGLMMLNYILLLRTFRKKK